MKYVRKTLEKGCVCGKHGTGRIIEGEKHEIKELDHWVMKGG